MKTITLAPESKSLETAVQSTINLIKDGEAVIVPTETAYGLAVDASNNEALKRLFELKQRDAGKPSAIFVNSAAQVGRYARIENPHVSDAMAQLWPGPVTFVMKAVNPNWPGIVSSSGKIGLRCSSHPFIRELISNCNHPLTATSANISGEKTDSVEDLINFFGDNIKLFIIDPDLNLECPPSTVVEITEDGINILREGKINTDSIRKLFKDVDSE